MSLSRNHSLTMPLVTTAKVPLTKKVTNFLRGGFTTSTDSQPSGSPVLENSQHSTGTEHPSSSGHPSTTAQAPTVNVILFGETGVGKSSVINLIAQRKLAKVSSDVQGCTMESTRYDISFDGMYFAIFDTIGLEEPEMGVNGYLKAIEKAFELITRLEAAGGIHLLLFCMRGGRITATTQSNYRMFYELLCNRKVPIALVFTNLENEPKEMEDWWERNKAHIARYGIKNQGHACITAVHDDTPEEVARYTVSQEKIRDLIRSCALPSAAPLPETHSWFAGFARGLKSLIKKRSDPGRKKLVKVLTQRCNLASDVAERIADMMEKPDAEQDENEAEPVGQTAGHGGPKQIVGGTQKDESRAGGNVGNMSEPDILSSHHDDPQLQLSTDRGSERTEREGRPNPEEGATPKEESRIPKNTPEYDGLSHHEGNAQLRLSGDGRARQAGSVEAGGAPNPVAKDIPNVESDVVVNVPNNLPSRHDSVRSRFSTKHAPTHDNPSNHHGNVQPRLSINGGTGQEGNREAQGGPNRAVRISPEESGTVVNAANRDNLNSVRSQPSFENTSKTDDLSQSHRFTIEDTEQAGEGDGGESDLGVPSRERAAVGKTLEHDNPLNIYSGGRAQIPANGRAKQGGDVEGQGGSNQVAFPCAPPKESGTTKDIPYLSSRHNTSEGIVQGGNDRGNGGYNPVVGAIPADSSGTIGKTPERDNPSSHRGTPLPQLSTNARTEPAANGGEDSPSPVVIGAFPISEKSNTGEFVGT